jgi:opacity protein-like surface antigen
LNGVTGITNSTSREWDVIAGIQYLLSQNIKLIGEYRHHSFEDTGGPSTARLKDDGFTVRVMLGF